MEGRGKVLSCVLTKKFLARPEKYFPRTAELNLACFHKNITFRQKTDLSKNFHRAQAEMFPCFPEYERGENNLIFSRGGGSVFQFSMNVAPHVHSLLIMSPLNRLNIIKQNKLPVKDAFV